MPNFGIGIVSSISCDPFREAFERAINPPANTDVIYTYCDEVGHHDYALANVIKKFVADSSISLIVTFGGHLPYVAANTNSGAKNFISLLGTVPPSPAIPQAVVANCLGGVSTDTVLRNQPNPFSVTFQANVRTVTSATPINLSVGDKIVFTPGVTSGVLAAGVTRNVIYKVDTAATPTTFTFTDLTNAPIMPTSTGTAPNYVWTSNWKNRVASLTKLAQLRHATEISLVYHSNSTLAVDELRMWNGGGVSQSGAWPELLPHFCGSPAGQAIPISAGKSLIRAFEDIPAKAVIISADPYFQQHKEALIQAANNSAAFVCYPFRNYLNRTGTNKPKGGQAVILGPSLEAAIGMMGQKANAIVNGGGNQGFDSAPTAERFV